MLNYPPGLLELWNSPAGCEFVNSPDGIVTLNRLVRMMHHFDWPEEYFVIGESGCGDYYAIDADDDHSSVYLWDPEVGDFSDVQEVPSLVEFAGRVLQINETVATMLANRQTLFERVQNWWRRRRR